MMDRSIEEFNKRRATWHGLGVDVLSATSANEVLQMAELDWNVYQRKMISTDGIPIEGYRANIRDVDDKVLGVVTDKYQVVQNKEAFQFTEDLLGEGVRYETAGSVQDGKKTWILAKMPYKYQMMGDWIEPYLVFYNSHDGSGSIKVAITPIRVMCQNTLNLALRKASRSWSTKHTGDIHLRLDEAKDTLFKAHDYMENLAMEMNNLAKIKISNQGVEDFINELIAIPSNATPTQEKNIKKLRKELSFRYFLAPDLKGIGNNGYKLINAVSDFATHAKPQRKTQNYKENLFLKTIDGHPMIDKAHKMLLQIA